MRLLKYFILICVLFPLGVKAQDVHFSNMEFLPLNLNPALAGANYDFEANLSYRNQWSSVSSPYQTIDASVYSRLNPNNKSTKRAYVVAGLDFYNDRAGTSRLVTNHVNLTFATHILMGENSSLGLGLYGGWGQRSIDFSTGTWGSQYDGMDFDLSMASGENLENSSYDAFDIGAGMVYTFQSKDSRISENDSKRFNIGFATYHINRPNYSFLNANSDRQYMRYSAFVNGSFGIRNTKVMLEPGVYFYKQGPAQEIYLGMNMKYILKNPSSQTIFISPMTLSFGLFYRNLDALIAKVMFDWNGLGIGIAYDINVFNSLTPTTRGNGAFELALRYVIPDYARRPFVKGGRMFY